MGYAAGGEQLVEAAVYLYHPPFRLDTAITYVEVEDGANELFSMPAGWGVLRSQCGLLLWLQLRAGEHLAAILGSGPRSAFKEGVLNQPLRFDFCSLVSSATVGLTITASADRIVSRPTPLLTDECLLHPVGPTANNLQLRLEASFGSKA